MSQQINRGHPIGGDMRHLWEVLFSLHLGFVGVSMAFVTSTLVAGPFMRMEIPINRVLHIRQTDFIRGHFEIWVPTVLVAFLIWSLLRISSRARLTQEFLRSTAGLITILSPAIFWIACQQMFWSWGSLSKGIPLEIAAALGCTLLFLSGKGKVPSWVTYFLVAAHYVYWYFSGGARLEASSYIGPPLRFWAFARQLCGSHMPQPHHYETLRSALLWAMGQAPSAEFDRETRAAWEDLLTAISAVMLEAAAQKAEPDSKHLSSATAFEVQCRLA